MYIMRLKVKQVTKLLFFGQSVSSNLPIQDHLIESVDSFVF